MMNLGVNTRDAMEEGGKLLLETENVVLDEGYCRDHLGARPGRYVLLSISDTGKGMDKKTGYNGFGGILLKPPKEADINRFCNQLWWYLN